MAFLSVESLKVRVGDRVFAFDFSCERGERVGILGPSGCGKTTFFRSVAGLERAISGKVALRDRDITYLAPHKRGIAMMFQDYAIYENLSVERNLKFVLLAKRVRHRLWQDMIKDSLTAAGLYEKRRQLSGTLSGGEKQRLALARCLIIPPAALLLDEPFNSLDKAMKRPIAEHLQDIVKGNGVTVIAVSHDEAELTDLIRCDRIVRAQDMIKSEIAKKARWFEA